MDGSMFFQSWATLGRTALVGALAYAALVVMLRVSGKRTLAKLNSFDLVVTVAIGSTLATILLDRTVALAEGLTAFALLIVMQWAVTSLSVRSPAARRSARAEPLLLVRRGTLLESAMQRARITESEVLQALRASGTPALEDVEAVVLETNGDLSVLKKGSASSTALKDVRQPEP